MRLKRPRSVLGLVLIGFSLVALPLLIAVIRAGYYVDHLAVKSQRLVIQGVQVTRVNERLSELITDMERYTRQFYVVGDPALWGLYLENKTQFIEVLASLKALDHEHLMATQISEMGRLGALLNETLPVVPSDGDISTSVAPPVMVARLSRLRKLASTIARNSNQLIDTEVESLDAQATMARKQLWWQSATLLPITIALGALFTVLIARPIRNLGAAITSLGEGGFSDRILVTGPPELHALGNRLDWLRRRLLAGEETKTMFLRHMSHELKTPLASLREGTELLADGSVGSLSPTQNEVAEILLENCLQLQTLIENLLDFSAWQHDASRLNLSSFDLRDIIDNSLEQHALEIRRKELRMEIEAESIELAADRVKVRTAVDNLLANAIKFSPEKGRILITVDTNGIEARLDVYDDGPGIPPSERDMVFEPFYQGTASTGSYIRGTGIGLSVVRECARAHHGSVVILDDGVGGGHFRLTLPLNAPEEKICA